MLVRALETGMAHAAYLRGGRGPREQLAETAAAAIASDMIRAGRGDEVLKIYASVAPADQDQDKGKGKGSWLSDTLSKLPGVGAQSAPEHDTHQADDDYQPFSGPCAPDSQSTGHDSELTFARQVPLLGGGDLADPADPGGPGGPPPGPPHRG